MIERLVPAGDGLVARVRCSERCDGDLRCRPEEAARPHQQDVVRRREALMAGDWTWLRQVHGREVVVVDRPGDSAGAEADGAVSAAVGAVLAVHTADCAPVVVVGDGIVGVAHAGWRGIVAGVLGEAVAALRSLAPGSADTAVRALVGPTIRPRAYEFGAAELDAVCTAVGCDVAGVTSWGAPALDLVAAVSAALRAAGVHDVEDLGFDTSGPGFFSHRARGDTARQATAVRLERSQ